MKSRFISIGNNIFNIKDFRRATDHKKFISLSFFHNSEESFYTEFFHKNELVVKSVYDRLQWFLGENFRKGNDCLFDFDQQEQECERWVQKAEEQMSHFAPVD